MAVGYGWIVSPVEDTKSFQEDSDRGKLTQGGIWYSSTIDKKQAVSDHLLEGFEDESKMFIDTINNFNVLKAMAEAKASCIVHGSSCILRKKAKC